MTLSEMIYSKMALIKIIHSIMTQLELATHHNDTQYTNTQHSDTQNKDTQITVKEIILSTNKCSTECRTIAFLFIVGK
jgi:hypothetical protein